MATESQGLGVEMPYVCVRKHLSLSVACLGCPVLQPTVTRVLDVRWRAGCGVHGTSGGNSHSRAGRVHGKREIVIYESGGGKSPFGLCLHISKYNLLQHSSGYLSVSF